MDCLFSAEENVARSGTLMRWELINRTEVRWQRERRKRERLERRLVGRSVLSSLSWNGREKHESVRKVEKEEEKDGRAERRSR